MLVQCENPSCRKPDNSDNATLCLSCHQPLPVRPGSRLSRPSASTNPAYSYGPWINCDPSTTTGQQISLQGHIDDVLEEGARSPSSDGTRSFFGKGFLAIVAGGIAGGVLVVVAALASLLAGQILISIAILVLGLLINMVLIQIAQWVLHKAAFLKGVTQKQAVLSAQSFTRTLAVRDAASTGGSSYEVQLTSSREMNIRSPQRGDQIELQGFLRGRKLYVVKYRSGTPL